MKRSIDAAHAAGCGRLPPGYVPRSATDLGMLLAGHPALTSCANALHADPAAAGGSTWGAMDSLQLVVQARAGAGAEGRPARRSHSSALAPCDRSTPP